MLKIKNEAEQFDFSNFELKIICKVCHKVFENLLSIQDMMQHNLDHHNEEQIEISLDEEEEIKNHQNKLHSLEKIERKIDRRILEQVEKTLNGGVAKGTKKQYRGPLTKFFQWLLDKHNKTTPNAEDIISYLLKFKLTVQSIAALQRVRTVFALDFTYEQEQICKKARQAAQEQIKVCPSQAWDLKLIQQFINDLVENGFELLACRIYALYQIGGKISELSQITVKMLTSGHISYIPYHQAKLGEKARREIYLGKEIRERIMQIVQKYNISEDQTLNIGKQKNAISVSALQKDLLQAKKTIKENVKEKSKEYEDFLEKFSYSDLRHSKIQSNEPPIIVKQLRVRRMRSKLEHDMKKKVKQQE